MLMQLEIPAEAESFLATTTGLLILGVAHPQTFFAVLPRLIQTWKEVVPWNHQYLAVLKACVQLFAVNGQPRKPYPEEHRPLRFMHSQRIPLQRIPQCIQRPHCLVLIEGLDMRFTELNDFTAGHPLIQQHCTNARH